MYPSFRGVSSGTVKSPDMRWPPVVGKACSITVSPSMTCRISRSPRKRYAVLVKTAPFLGVTGKLDARDNVVHLPTSCGTLPVTFRNTDPNPEGLVAGRNYPAPVRLERTTERSPTCAAAPSF